MGNAEQFNKFKLLDALNSIPISSTFASFATLTRCDPDIFVPDIGKINIPLSDSQAKQLIAKSRQAPCAGGGGTIVDKSVPDNWKLDPDQFEIRAPTWRTYLDTILTHVVRQLDIIAPVSAQLCRMVLYQEGTMVKAHTDTEKIPGMFGTLVINLPSPHDGGDMVLAHGSKSVMFRTSQYDMTYAFWFSDVSYEVLPVRSGYRWALTYSLALDPSAEVSIEEVPTASRRIEYRELRKLLMLYVRDVSTCMRDPNPLCYVLDHKYTEANTSYRGLESADSERVKCLGELSPDLDFDVFLATLEKEMRGRTDTRGHRSLRGHIQIDDVQDIRYCLKSVFDLDGNKLASGLPLEEDWILQRDPFEDGPNGESYSKCKDDPSVLQVTHWYSLSALVIIPCEGTVSFLTSKPRYYRGPMDSSVNGSNFHELLNYFVTKSISSPENDGALAQLHKFLKASYEEPGFETLLTKDHLLGLFQATIRSRDPDLLNLIAARNTQPPPIEFISWLKQEYDRFAVRIVEFKRLFNYSFRLQPTICQHYEALSAITGDAETRDELRGIVSEAVDKVVEICRVKRLYREEGRALFDISLYHRDVAHLKTVVVPVVEARSRATAFILGFLKALRQSIAREQVSQDEGQPLYEHIARLLLKDIDLSLLAAIDEETEGGDPCLENTHKFEFITQSSMLEFISTLTTPDLQEHLDLFAQQVSAQAKRIRGEEFNRLWIPLLQDLFLVFEKRKITVTAPCWMQVYRSLLQAYIRNYVQEPLLSPAGISDAAVETWRERKLEASCQLEVFNQEMLRLVLGELFDDIRTKLYGRSQQSIAPDISAPSASFHYRPQPLVTGSTADRLMRIDAEQALINAEIARKAGQSSTTRNPYSMTRSGPVPPARTIATASQWAPTAPELEILEYSPKLAQRNPSSSTRRVSGTSNPAGSRGSTLSRSAPTNRNPPVGAKRKHIEVIDLTGDD